MRLPMMPSPMNPTFMAALPLEMKAAGQLRRRPTRVEVRLRHPSGSGARAVEPAPAARLAPEAGAC
jgi:hypothetical protein